MSESNNDSCMDLEEAKRVTDEKLKEIIEEKYKTSAPMIQNEEKEKI